MIRVLSVYHSHETQNQKVGPQSGISHQVHEPNLFQIIDRRHLFLLILQLADFRQPLPRFVGFFYPVLLFQEHRRFWQFPENRKDQGWNGRTCKGGQVPFTSDKRDEDNENPGVGLRNWVISREGAKMKENCQLIKWSASNLLHFISWQLSPIFYQFRVINCLI